jgi:CPA1 family monovalent cation:H+ antiporter
MAAASGTSSSTIKTRTATDHRGKAENSLRTASGALPHNPVMHADLLVLGLLVAIPALSVLARALDIPYPIVLVLGALPIGFIPGVPNVRLEPDLVLVLFLPPLLYVAAFFASLRELRADLRSISLLSIGLVLFTTCAVAVVAHALIDGLPWAAAFALGAVVSPTDPLAATTIARRLGAPRRVVSIVEGESLVNDATALVAYRLAVVAAVGGGFSAAEAGLRFLGGAAGGICVGLAVGWLIAAVRRRIDDPPVEVTISLFTGYAAYLPAEELGLSGVLAAVTAGIYMGWLAPHISSATMRMQGYAVWEFVVFLLNAVLFMLVGLQLPTVLDGLEGIAAVTLAGYAIAVCAVVVGARVIWLFTLPYVIRALDRRPQQLERRMPASLRLVVAWAGMRGAVSLAAALALPLETDAGAPFPERSLLVFLAYVVILFTLVVQGLTLPGLIRRLRVEEDGTEGEEERTARIRAAEAALERLDRLSSEDWVREDTVARVRGVFEYRRRRFVAQAEELADDGYEHRSLAYQRILRELIEAQREVLVRMRNERLISNDVMHRIERELDLEESRLEI